MENQIEAFEPIQTIIARVGLVESEVKKIKSTLSRQKKIENIRNKISSGKYRVSNMELAKAMILFW